MKKLIINSIIILAAMSVSAQKNPQLFSGYLGTGLSALAYKPDYGDKTGALGVDFGFGYTFTWPKERVTAAERIFNEQIGFYTGFGFSFYNANAKVNGEEVNNGKVVIDDEGDEFELFTTLSGYKEKQNAMFLTIPVMGRYQLDDYYGMLGFKFGIPLNGRYNSKDATITNRAHYVEYDNWLNEQEFAGYGTFRNRKSDGKVDLGVAVMLSLEGGYRFRLKSDLSVYAGAYLDIGLNNVVKNRTTLVNYDASKPKDFTTNSVMSSLTDKTRIMAVGVKAHIAWQYK